MPLIRGWIRSHFLQYRVNYSATSRIFGDFLIWIYQKKLFQNDIMPDLAFLVFGAALAIATVLVAIFIPRNTKFEA